MPSSTENGKTKIEIEWSVRAGLSEHEGPQVTLYVEGKQGSAWLPMTPEQAFDMAAQLSHAAEWCKRKDAC